MTFYQVDAFTETPYIGNPCAVFPEAPGLTDFQMIQIAREMNLSETAFLMNSDRADLRARYFTPTGEIPLAGHPTIASTIALIHLGRITPPSGEEEREFSLELEAGVITVAVKSGDGVPWVTMRQLPPSFGRSYDPAQVAAVFGLEARELLEGVPVQTVSTGTPQLMVPLSRREALGRATLRLEGWQALKARGDFSTPHLFYLSTEGSEPVTYARHFGGASEESEDPFTGSATGGMACYLYAQGLLSGTSLTALQGGSVGRPGIARVKVTPDPSRAGGVGSVEVTGTGVVVFSGELLSLPPETED